MKMFSLIIWKFKLVGATAAKKGILIGVVLISVNQLSGLFAFLNYTADIFVEAGSSFSPNVSATIVGVLLCVGSLVSLAIVDRFSRKFLYCATTLANLMGLFAMGIHSYYKVNGNFETFSFVPVMSLSLVIFASSIGRLPLTYIMMAEIMPQNIRSLGISICTTFNWLWAFILLRFFSTAVDVLHFHNCMILFSLVCVFGMIFVIAVVPETKSRSFEDIENSLSRKKLKYIEAATTGDAKDELEGKL